MGASRTMKESDRKELQQDLRELMLAHVEYEELLKKVEELGKKIRRLVITAEELLDQN